MLHQLSAALGDWLPMSLKSQLCRASGRQRGVGGAGGGRAEASLDYVVELLSAFLTASVAVLLPTVSSYEPCCPVMIHSSEAHTHQEDQHGFIS